jgi:hypothetical protein
MARLSCVTFILDKEPTKLVSTVLGRLASSLQLVLLRKYLINEDVPGFLIQFIGVTVDGFQFAMKLALTDRECLEISTMLD